MFHVGELSGIGRPLQVTEQRFSERSSHNCGLVWRADTSRYGYDTHARDELIVYTADKCPSDLSRVISFEHDTLRWKIEISSDKQTAVCGRT
jgi:hypothetical protein